MHVVVSAAIRKPRASSRSIAVRSFFSRWCYYMGSVLPPWTSDSCVSWGITSALFRLHFPCPVDFVYFSCFFVYFSLVLPIFTRSANSPGSSAGASFLLVAPGQGEFGSWAASTLSKAPYSLHLALLQVRLTIVNTVPRASRANAGSHCAEQFLSPEPFSLWVYAWEQLARGSAQPQLRAAPQERTSLRLPFPQIHLLSI